jgi:hypothetical protein
LILQQPVSIRFVKDFLDGSGIISLVALSTTIRQLAKAGASHSIA